MTFRMMASLCVCLAAAVSAAETSVRDVPAGWTTVAPREEIKPAFRYEAKGGRAGREAFVIAGDNRDPQRRNRARPARCK